MPLRIDRRIRDTPRTAHSGSGLAAYESSEGSGLGLYIVKETIEKLNGRIEVNSEPGVGTAFNIHIPNHPTSNLLKKRHVQESNDY